jgi:hypothetical protein
LPQIHKRIGILEAAPPAAAFQVALSLHMHGRAVFSRGSGWRMGPVSQQTKRDRKGTEERVAALV